MKTKVLLISLIGLLILFTITYKAYSDECGYYFSWYGSCEGDECIDHTYYWVWGSEAGECECRDYGAWDTCRTVKDWGTVCTVTIKLLEYNCNGPMEVHDMSYADICTGERS